MHQIIRQVQNLSFSRSIWFKYFFVTALIVVVACSSDEEPTPTNIATDSSPIPSATPQVLPTAIQHTVTPTVPTTTPTLLETAIPVVPTATTIPEFKLPELELTSAIVEPCRLSGDINQSGNSGFGTAPAPTPTPVMGGIVRPESVIITDFAEYRAEITPIVDAQFSLNNSFMLAWPSADSVEKQAGQLFVFGKRLSQLCSAMSQPNVPVELIGEAVGLAESIRARHAWVSLAIEQLECCGDARSEFMNIGLNTTSLALEVSASNLTQVLNERLGSHPSDLSREFTSERFLMTMSIPADTLVIRNTVDLLAVIIEPSELLDPTSIGPGSDWSDGTGIRVRRVRNRTELSVEQALTEYAGIVSKFGAAQSSDELDIPNIDDIHLIYPLSSQSWSGSVSVLVSGDYTYLIEIMCSGSDPEVCAELQAAVESVKFQ